MSSITPLQLIAQLYDPETNQPFVLLPAERQFLDYAFRTGDDGRLLYPEMIYSCPKKSGKTTFGALCTLIMTLLYGGAYPEATIVANDLDQARGRVFEMIRRIVEASPLLRADARVTSDKISFPSVNATITAVASDYAGAAGGNQNIAVFDELWAVGSERGRRLWDELIPPPTRKLGCRLTVTYAGFEGESDLLFELYKRGLQQQQVAKDLYAGDGMLMFWTHDPVAPWQTEAWLAEMRRSLRPNQFLRMIQNHFVTTESSFIDVAAWDRCVEPNLSVMSTGRFVPLYVGVDASVKHDSTAIVAVAWEEAAQVVRLACHRVFQPSPDQPLDFEATIEASLLDLHKRFYIKQVLFDPYQMQASAQRLARAGLPIQEFPQSSPNLTAASQNLYELIQTGTLAVYPDPGMRLAISRAIAVETPRGWRIGKQTQFHKIDVVVALAMACHAAIQSQREPVYDHSYRGWDDNPTNNDRETSAADYQHARLRARIYGLSGGQLWPG